MTLTDAQTFTTRAVRRRVAAGCYDLCTACGEMIKFVARNRGHRVICNIYEDGEWQRVEHWHEACYETLQPYGELQD